MVAIPNIVGVVRNNRNKQYVEDAKKLVSLAEYKVRSNPSIMDGHACIRLTINYLGEEEFDSSPSGKYDFNQSFVDVEIIDSEYKYSVITKDDKSMGIKYTDSKELFNDDAFKTLIVSNPVSSFSCDVIS